MKLNAANAVVQPIPGSLFFDANLLVAIVIKRQKRMNSANRKNLLLVGGWFLCMVDTRVDHTLVNLYTNTKKRSGHKDQ